MLNKKYLIKKILSCFIIILNPLSTEVCYLLINKNILFTQLNVPKSNKNSSIKNNELFKLVSVNI